MNNRIERKQEFIKELAEYLAGDDQALKSIRLALGTEDARQWAKLRAASPLFGWCSAEEAERELTEFLC